MKKIYLLLLVLFSFTEMKGQGCIINYAYDSTTTVFDFAVAPVSGTSVFRWDFGDSTGIYTTGNIATHSYTNFGNYLVCVNEFDTVLQSIVDACCINIAYNNTAGCSFYAASSNGLNIDFTANASSASTITWDFGDGQTGSGFANTHNYFSPGTYNVCMTSSSFLGNCSYCQLVTVVNNSCYFTSSIDSLDPSVAHFSFAPFDPSNIVTWNFGNGNSATGLNPSNQYTAPGTYTVCVTETDSIGTVICSVCNPITIQPSITCYFTAIPALGAPLNTFFFNASFDSTIYSAVWDFGDGISYGTQGPFTQHTYPSGPGIYYACMQLIENTTQNVVCTYCQALSMGGPTPCQANFTTVPFGLDAYFIDYSSADPAVTTYTWDFGDGSPLSTARFPIHTYGIPGTYNVCLSIMNSACADTICQSIVVDSTIIAPVFCTSYFIFTQLSPYQLAVVNLSSGTNLSFMWDFGDGSTSNAAYPIHNYSSTGTFQICLTVADGSGCTNTYCDSLTVDSTGMITYRSTAVGFTINVVSPTQLNTVSVDENISSLISNFYPNPASDRIFVTVTSKSTATKYSILSISSQKIKEGKISGEKSEIDISDLSPGIYFLEVRNSSGEKSFGRFIKN